MAYDKTQFRDVRAGRLSAQTVEENFADIHPPLSRSEAVIAADRCYFCHDAPCVAACPTGIDIPAFIQKIRSGNLPGAAETILDANIMGGMCARVCPTEVLCEQDCVRNLHEDKPVDIGLLQRHAVDPSIEANTQFFARAPDTGKHIAVVGAGPAGLSCAHRLARLGHRVTIYEQRDQPGGLNEYGIAAYKTPGDFARREVDYILAIGNIELRTGQSLGETMTLADLRRQHDAVFLGIGLAGVNDIALDNADAVGVENAVEYIATLRQTQNKATLPVARRIVVIGGGMTAIDIAVQSKRLGAEEVTIAYRRSARHMGASRHEQHFAQTNGVIIRHLLKPVQMITRSGQIAGVAFERVIEDEAGGLTGTGETISLPADVVFLAIGQTLRLAHSGGTSLALDGNRIGVDEHFATSVEGVWAGGDCVRGGDDLTVTAVEHGKQAACAIHTALT